MEKPINNNKGLVIWGTNLQSTTGKRYTKYELNIIKLPNNIKSIILGIILSDGHIALHSKGKNAYLIFNQSLSKLAYVYFIFSFLNHYCQSYPSLNTRYTLKTSSSILRIATRSMPCITELHNNYYLNKVKTINNSIYDDLTPIALAHWIMGDGTFNTSVIFCTDSFSLKEVILLINVLIIKYEINCIIRYHCKIYPRIYVRKESLLKLRLIVKPYMHPSMLYKLGL